MPVLDLTVIPFLLQSNPDRSILSSAAGFPQDPPGDPSSRTE